MIADTEIFMIDVRGVPVRSTGQADGRQHTMNTLKILKEKWKISR